MVQLDEIHEPTQPDLAESTEIVGQRIRNIRVERLLGAGGMSEGWRGFDEKLQRPVALKVVHGRRRRPAAQG